MLRFSSPRCAVLSHYRKRVWTSVWLMGDTIYDSVLYGTYDGQCVGWHAMSDRPSDRALRSFTLWRLHAAAFRRRFTDAVSSPGHHTLSTSPADVVCVVSQYSVAARIEGPVPGLSSLNVLNTLSTVEEDSQYWSFLWAITSFHVYTDNCVNFCCFYATYGHTLIYYINAKKTSQFKTQCKGDISHAFKTAKITVFDLMMWKSPDVPLQAELVTLGLQFNYPTENQPTFNTCSVALMGIVIQMINTAARLVRHILLHIMGSNTVIFAVLNSWLMSPLHCVINWEVFCIDFCIFKSLIM